MELSSTPGISCPLSTTSSTSWLQSAHPVCSDPLLFLWRRYGYFTVVSGIGLSLTGLGASALMTFNIGNHWVLLIAQALAGLSIAMSVVFAVGRRQRLRDMSV